MPVTGDGKDIMLWALAGAISHVSLHSGQPNDRNELSGGVYRRKRIDFVDPVSGEMKAERQVEIEVPQGARVTHAGFWTTEIGGSMLAWARTSEHVFRGRGVYVVDLAKVSLE